MTKITKIDKKRSACAHALMIMIPENVCVFQMASVPLRKGLATKSDEFSEDCQGRGHFQSKNLYCRFWEPGLLEHEIDTK